MPSLPLAWLLLVLLWAPLPLASNRVWSLGLLSMMLFGGVLLHLAVSGIRLRALRLPGTLATPGVLLAAGLCSMFAAQLVLGLSSGGPWAGTQHLLRSLGYLGAMCLCLLAVQTRQHALWLLLGVLSAALLQALLAAGLFAYGRPYVYLFSGFDPRTRATGTFVNADHLAGYMELGLSAGVGAMLALMTAGSTGAQRWADRLRSVAAFVMSPKMLVRLSLVPLVLALVLTRSRMGNGVFFLGIVLVAGVLAWRSPRWRKPALWLVASMLVVDLIVLGQWVGLDHVVNRLKDTAEATVVSNRVAVLAGEAPPPSEESLQERLTVPLTSLPLVWQKPLLGWGGGSYAVVYPQIKPPDVFGGWWDHAHNDYVQVAVDAGLIGLALWVSIGLYTLWRLWPLLSDGNHPVDRGVAVAALMALVCLGLHSVVDFNMHIPANAMTLSVMLALVWAIRALPPERAARATRDEQQQEGKQ